MDEHQTPNDSLNDMKLWPLWLWVALLILLIAGLLAFLIAIPFLTPTTDPATLVSNYGKIFANTLFLPILALLGFAAWGAAKRTRYGLYLAITLLSFFGLRLLYAVVSEILKPYPLDTDWLERLLLLPGRIGFGLIFWIWILGNWINYFVVHSSKFGSRNQKRPR